MNHDYRENMTMFVQKIVRKSAIITSFTGLIKLASLAKISFIAGTYTGFFSAINIVSPLAGAFGGIVGSIGVFSISAIIRLMFFGALPLHFLAYYIPGFCASLYWARPQNIIINVFLPLICMILFVMHPVGFYAAPYAFYWLIPISLYFVAHKNLFLHALSSTFIAHAVGSVIWLYTVPMMIGTWYLLMPVVAVERVAFALGMVLLYKAISYVQQRAGYVVTTISQSTGSSVFTKFVK